MTPTTFRSAPPEVLLVQAFARPLDNAVATARTCYSSKGIVTPEQVGGDALSDEKRAVRRERRDALAKDLYAAGHHTTFQHAHFQFTLDRVSRHFVWSFLHSHPFYNSEQVSQRYVEVKPGTTHRARRWAAARRSPIYGSSVRALVAATTTSSPTC